MSRAKDVLKRLLNLADRGKLGDADINAILNGMLINSTHTYKDGLLVAGDGGVTTCDPLRIDTVAWPKATFKQSVKVEVHKKP